MKGGTRSVDPMTRSEEPFLDRIEAGQLLGRALKKYAGQGAVVLGIPRGGMVVGREIARALDASLDIVISRKLRAPGNRELAIGSISEGGKVFLYEPLLQHLRVSDIYVEKEKEYQVEEIAQRVKLYRRFRTKVNLDGRLVIVTDDGLATGATMQAALWAARQESPKKLIAAVPVGSEESVLALADFADELLCLRIPGYFMAVGQFYRRFDQVEDREVVEILRTAR